MAKFLHCADLHIDTKFQYLDQEKNAIRKVELRDVFSRIVSLAIAEEVDVVFISGDLFEGVNATADSLELITAEISRAANTRFFITPGNHDPYTPASQYSLMKLPSNAHIFSSIDIEKIVLENLKLEVYGAGFVTATCASNLLEGFVKLPSDNASIYIIHGDIYNQGSPYNYMNPSEIERFGFEYVALGHIHMHSNDMFGNTRFVYPGIPEGRGFDELGDKGVVIGTVLKGHTQIEFRPISKRKYFIENVDVSRCEDLNEIASLVRNRVFEFPETNFFKIVLTGASDFEIDIAELYEMICDLFYFVKIEDVTTAKIPEGHYHEDSLRGIFLEKIHAELKNATDEDQKKLLTMAKNFGVAALERREIRR